MEEALLPPIGLALPEGVFQHSVQLYGTLYFIVELPPRGWIVHNGDRTAFPAGYRESHTHRSGGRILAQACLLCRRRRSKPVDDGLGKLERVVDIGEIRHQPDRNAECPLLPTVNDVEKLLVRHALFLAK